MTAGAWVLLVAVVGAIAFGVYRAAVDGRFRGTHPVRGASGGDEAGGSGGRAISGGRGARRPGAEPRDPSTDAGPEPSPLLMQAIDHTLGETATFVQFSSAFCAPCRATRRILHDVAEIVPGVVHHEIDAEHHLDLVRHVGVLRTPTTLVLDARGAEVARASGAPTKAQVLTQLASLA
ncbi:thioredoxin family protein [Nocardioides sp. GCM10027114]